MTSKRLVPTLVLVALAVVALAGAVLSPFALAASGELMHLDWKTLADIGQAYGGTSALVSALALAGVAASIAYQVRAVRQQRHQAVRDQQRELLLLLNSDPETYARAFSPRRARMDAQELRRDVYAQMWLQFLSFAYETGHYAESHLRSGEGESLFSTECLRSHWAEHRDEWMSSPDSKARRFALILDDVYRKVIAVGPPPDAEPSQLAKSNASDRRPAVGYLAAAAVLVVTGWMVGRRKREVTLRLEPGSDSRRRGMSPERTT